MTENCARSRRRNAPTAQEMIKDSQLSLRRYWRRQAPHRDRVSDGSSAAHRWFTQTFVRAGSTEGNFVVAERILLTSAGFQNDRVGRAFVELLDRPVPEAKILFIPTAAMCAESSRMVGKCIDELYRVGISPENVVAYDLDRRMSSSEIEDYDAVYFTGGDSKRLLDKVNETDFAPVVKAFVANGGVFVGVSAGSLLATHIALVNCRLTGLHCQDGSPNGQVDLTSCPDVRLTDDQGLRIDDSGSRIIG